MYQILCDCKVIYDPRDDNLIVNSPKCKLEVNKVCEASFSIYATHPYYGHLQKMRSVFEILQDGDTIFRGRMTDDTKDFDNIKLVDLEGAMAYFNDSIIRPFIFPDDFLDDSEYNTAASSGNVVEFFLNWLINQHNSQVQPFQQFKLGKVTVADPNNYITRSSEEYLKTWEVLKTRLFESSIGGHLCIRYEDDGNYIDYLEDFELTNTQKIKFGENLLDLSNESDASETYSALIPLGKKKNEIDSSSEDESRLTIESLPDCDITDDIVKSGDTIYSKSAVEKYGWIYAPVSETTWEDVTEAENLQTKGTEYLTKTAVKLSNTIEIKAVDLHFSDEEIEGFRIYRYIDVESAPHDQQGRYPLTQLDIDIQNPQNTVITIGGTVLTLTDINARNKKESAESIEIVKQNTSAEIQKQVAVIDADIQVKINTSITEFLNNEWNALELDEDFVAYNGAEENQPMYKVTGNVVEVKGCIVPLAEYTSGTEKVVFAGGITEEARPSSVRSFVCQGAEMNRWMLTVETDGSLTISRYGISECVTVPTTEGLPFNGTYII